MRDDLSLLIYETYPVNSYKPGTFEEFVKNQVWKDAMHEEYESIMKNDVWDVVPRPKDNLLSPRNGSTRSSMEPMEVLKSYSQDFFPEASLQRKVLSSIVSQG